MSEFRNLLVNVKEREMVPTLSILADVVDGWAIGLNFSNAQVPLKISHVVERVPQTKLYE
jgi:hypothetical protein